MLEQEEKKNTRRNGLVLERAIRFEGRRIPGVNCIQRVKSLTRPRVLQGLKRENTKDRAARRKGRRPGAEPGAGGNLRRVPRGPGGAALGGPRGQAGRREVLGCGAECSMAYPGHPGAGGGYYAGGVSTARAGSWPGLDPWTPGAPRSHTGHLGRGGSPAPPPCPLRRPAPPPAGLGLRRPPSFCPFFPLGCCLGPGRA